MSKNAGTIKIDSVSELDVVNEYTFEHYPNKHPKAYIKGVLKKKTDINRLIEKLDMKQIKVEFEGNTDTHTIFIGYINDIKISLSRFNYYEIELYILGNSCKLDEIERERSFQNVENTHKQVVNRVLKKISKSQIVWNLKREEKIEMPVLQYKETDWQFIKRMVSIYHVPVIVDAYTEKVNLEAGYEEKIVGEFNNYNYIVGVSDQYYKLGGQYCGLEKRDFLYYKIKSKKIYKLGKKVIFNQEQYYVCGVEAEWVREELIYTYKLGRNGLTYVKTMSNRNLIGYTVVGSVIKTDKETVKVDLDLKDDDHNTDEAYAYDWKPQSGNLFYCMPEERTKVSLKFGDSNEKSAAVIECINEKNKKVEEIQIMENPRDKCFTTEDGLSLELKMNKIKFALSEDKETDIELVDDILYILSDKNIKMTAKKEICFVESDYFFEGVYKDVLNMGGEFLDSFTQLDYQFNIYSSNVKISMSTKKQFPNEIKEKVIDNFDETKEIVTLAVIVVGAGTVAVVTVTTFGTGTVPATVAMSGFTATCFTAKGIYDEDASRGVNSGTKTIITRCITQYVLAAVSGGVGSLLKVEETLLKSAALESVSSGLSTVCDEYILGERDGRKLGLDGFLSGITGFVTDATLNVTKKSGAISYKLGQAEQLEEINLREQSKYQSAADEYNRTYRNVSNSTRKQNAQLYGKQIGQKKEILKETKETTKKNIKINKKKINKILSDVQMSKNDKYSLKILNEVNDEHPLINGVNNGLDNFGKPYIENNATFEWPNKFGDKIDISQNRTNPFPMPDMDAKISLLKAAELKEQMEKEEKKKELKKSCSFDTWIEEKYMDIVY